MQSIMCFTVAGHFAHGSGTGALVATTTLSATEQCDATSLLTFALAAAGLPYFVLKHCGTPELSFTMKHASILPERVLKLAAIFDRGPSRHLALSRFNRIPWNTEVLRYERSPTVHTGSGVLISTHMVS